MRKRFTAGDHLWFTSDPHLGHEKLALLRGFESRDHFTEAFVTCWNVRVPRNGHGFILGDFSFYGAERTREILERMNGTKYLIRGNHDKHMAVKTLAMFAGGVAYYHEIRVDEQRIVLCHCAFRSWPEMHYGSWNLHGHSHGSLPPQGKQMDVGYDSLGYAPISYQQVALLMKQRAIAVVDHHVPKEMKHAS